MLLGAGPDTIANIFALLFNTILAKGVRPLSGRESSPLGLNPVIHTIANGFFESIFISSSSG